MTDESLLLYIDIIEKHYEKALAKTRSDLAVKEALLDVKNAILVKSPPAGKLYASAEGPFAIYILIL